MSKTEFRKTRMYLASLAVDTTSADPTGRHCDPRLQIYCLLKRDKLLDQTLDCLPVM